MSDVFKAVKITERVHWVGAIDWAVRDFHGYTTNRGSTYNAYLVRGEKNILIDTVKKGFGGEMLARISSLIRPEDIDCIVSNHSEPDHSGCLPETAEIVKPEKIYASAMGAKALQKFYDMGDKITAVKDGESVKIGGLNFTFLETRMLHWPDSMAAYLADEKILFSQDGFGMHLASSERFADEVSEDMLREEGRRYFANILTPYAALVTNLLKKVAAMKIEISMILPDHGPVWRGGGVKKILDWWGGWAAQQPERKAVVVFGSMWGCTGAMARAIGEGLGGAIVKMMPVESCHRSDVAAEALGAGALIVGSPTLNNNILPAVADVVTYVKGLRPQIPLGAAFGSYGWSGEAVDQLTAILQGMKIEVVGEIKANYKPDSETLHKCRALGENIAAKLSEICAQR